jgi:O-antigen ligase
MKGLILTYLVAATASIGALRYPLIGLYAYVGFAVLRPQFIWGWAGPMDGISFVVGVTLIVGWTLRGFGSWRLGRARPIILALGLFVGWFLLSAALARNTTRSFASVLDFARIVVPFLAGFTLLDSEKEWRPLLWTIVLAQGYVALEMNWDYLRGYNMAGDGFGGMDNNSFAVSLVSVLGLAIAVALASKTWLARGLAAAAAALILHTTLLTFSRGGLVGLIAVGATAVVIMPKRPKYIGAILVTVLLAIRLTGPQLADRYATVFAPADARDVSSESRVDLWLDCIKVIESYPLLGVGPANWQVVAADYGWPPGKSAHSVWMETAAEVGIPGVFALMMFFGWAAIRLWPIARAKVTDENRYEVALASGIVLSIVGFSTSGQFVSVPGLEVQYYIVMLGAAMLKSKARTPVQAAIPIDPPPPWEYQPAFGPPLQASPGARQKR